VLKDESLPSNQIAKLLGGTLDTEIEFFQVVIEEVIGFVLLYRIPFSFITLFTLYEPSLVALEPLPFAQ
jgi:hypothetical protein